MLKRNKISLDPKPNGMRILIYTQRIGKKTINFIHNEILYLDKRHDVLALSHFISKENPIELNQLKFIRHYENRIVGKGKRLLRKIGLPIPSFENEFNKEVKLFKPDVIHIHFGNIAVRILDYFHQTDIPIFISFHGYDASRKLKEPNYISQLNKLFSRPNIHPIFVSQFMLQNIKKSGVNVRNHEILFYGTDVSKFVRKQKYGYDKNPFIFLQISSFAEKKGHEITLKAYKKFLTSQPKIETKLVLGGGGNGIEEIKSLSEELNLDKHVEFKGWVDIEMARDLMEKSHAFLHHSITASNGDMEGIPNAIMEAMAMELPVISTLHSGIPELVEDQVNGYLVEEKDISAYAQRMNDILDWNLLKINREKILSHFEREKHGIFLTEFYKKRIN